MSKKSNEENGEKMANLMSADMLHLGVRPVTRFSNEGIVILGHKYCFVRIPNQLVLGNLQSYRYLNLNEAYRLA